MSALDKQEGGDHYASMKIQPIEFINANQLDFLQGNIVKYACRHKHKGGAEDLRKVIHYAELALQLQYGEGQEKAAVPDSRLENQRAGIARAKAMGKYKGGTRRIDRQAILDVLNRGVSIRDAARDLGVGVSTVQRIKKEAEDGEYYQQPLDIREVRK